MENGLERKVIAGIEIMVFFDKDEGYGYRASALKPENESKLDGFAREKKFGIGDKGLAAATKYFERCAKILEKTYGFQFETPDHEQLLMLIDASKKNLVGNRPLELRETLQEAIDCLFESGIIEDVPEDEAGKDGDEGAEYRIADNG